jgi:hypothetical protein
MLAGKIIGWWVLLSVTLGPCLTWLFFYSERRDTRDRDVPTGDPAESSAHSSNPDAREQAYPTGLREVRI